MRFARWSAAGTEYRKIGHQRCALDTAKGTLTYHTDRLDSFVIATAPSGAARS